MIEGPVINELSLSAQRPVAFKEEDKLEIWGKRSRKC